MKGCRLKYLAVGVSSVVGCVMATGVFAQQEQVTEQNGVTTITFPERTPQASNGIDYKNAKPIPLPSINFDFDIGNPRYPASDMYPGKPGYSPGGQGDGKLKPEVLVPRSQIQNSSEELDLGGVEPAEYGTSNIPFTTSRVDVISPPSPGPSNQISKYWPFRPAGKLFFSKSGTDSWICSASLIKKGIAVTAAHCVSEFGKNRVYSKFQFVPAYYNGIAPYGLWTARSVRIPTAYLNGSSPCASGASGVVCRDDVAVITLNTQGSPAYYPGKNTGWYGYGYNGYGFTSNKEAQITQLGYPASHDQGKLMQRTDSLGFTYAPAVNNTIIGSRQTGGSSGGPWLVNLGIPAVLVGTGYGSGAVYNTVVGTTSWQNTTAAKYLGASPFLSTNIHALVTAACTATPAACAP
jgi:V8-like Glu-specific endopeptidase